jgi:hypothetical protein
MAFVQLSQEAEGGGQAAEAAPGAVQPPPDAPAPAADEAERAKARSKIWTPPGA